MVELTLLQAVVLGAAFIEFALYKAARKLGRDPWVYRALGVAALVVGVPAIGWSGFSAGTALWHGAWRAALEGVLLLYVLGMATWLGWRESKPF
jgi:uncharacterized membrane protein HdeD (DUF308 family)